MKLFIAVILCTCIAIHHAIPGKYLKKTYFSFNYKTLKLKENV